MVLQAIGHTFAGGGGPCNEFGLAFMNHRSTWSEELCNLDSDGDGATNGEELGDPCCVWKFGDTPSRSTLLSHPGEPNEFTRAELDKLKCTKAPRDECACMSGNCTNGNCQGCNLVDDEGGYYCVPDVAAAGCYMLQYPYMWCGELP
ncbi:a1-alpha2 repression [Aphanomyces cochlioides]|nr:a1-alpha2 repression [Aphanomyces cochlioides]